MATAAKRPEPRPAPARPAGRARLTLCLDGVPYAVRPLPAAEMPPGAVRGFVLSRVDRRLGRVAHRVTEGFEGVACSCGDQLYRRAPAGAACKHLRAARAVGLF